MEIKLKSSVEKLPSISLVIACKNERESIKELVERIPKFTGDMEVIFVDGHSTDGTCEEIQKCVALYPEKNIYLFDQAGSEGKGGAVRIGFEKATKDILAILDADLSVAPEEIRKFYDCLTLTKGHLVIGSRMIYPMEKGAMKFLNFLGNKFFSGFLSYLTHHTITDTLCGTKALYRSDYEAIRKNLGFFGFFDPYLDFDLLLGATKLNLKIIEVPVKYYKRRYGTTKIHRFRDGFLLLRMCLIATKKLKLNSVKK